jgi:hypothetical protein
MVAANGLEGGRSGGGCPDASPWPCQWAVRDRHCSDHGGVVEGGVVDEHLCGCTAQDDQPDTADCRQQEVVYPIAAINQARNSVTQFENQFSQVSNLFKGNVSSATLPQSQNLESILLSRNAGNLSTVSPQFQNVYGVVMAQNAASLQIRNMTDMTDAQAQDAMKRAIQIDALADAELAEADKMGQQISAAAPGSAPILEAEADVWVVRANAYTQSALAELMRTRGIDIANQSKLSKLAATDSTSSNGLINGVLTNR